MDGQMKQVKQKQCHGSPVKQRILRARGIVCYISDRLRMHVNKNVYIHEQMLYTILKCKMRNKWNNFTKNMVKYSEERSSCFKLVNVPPKESKTSVKCEMDFHHWSAEMIEMASIGQQSSRMKITTILSRYFGSYVIP